MYKNAANLYNTLLVIYFNYYDIIIDEEKKRWIKDMILVIYFLKIINMMNGTKKMKKKSKLQPQGSVTERVKLRTI